MMVQVFQLHVFMHDAWGKKDSGVWDLANPGLQWQFI